MKAPTREHGDNYLSLMDTNVVGVLYAKSRLLYSGGSHHLLAQCLLTRCLLARCLLQYIVW